MASCIVGDIENLTCLGQLITDSYSVYLKQDFEDRLLKVFLQTALGIGSFYEQLRKCYTDSFDVLKFAIKNREADKEDEALHGRSRTIL